ncbi:MAG: replication protein RepA [Acetobacteraceae bacterium]
MTEPTDEKPSGLSRTHWRLIDLIGPDDDLSFQHTVFCQTSLPYRDPGDEVRLWQRSQGATFLEIEAGRVYHPALKTTVAVGLPWGTKPRLILAHLNAEAIRKGSPVIEVESSLTGFVRRIRGFKHGREIRAFKEQLSRLSVAVVRLAIAREERAAQINTQLITKFELWPEKDERQRVLWPSTITLSREYFDSLRKHAVPLREADLAALAHSAMALDIYSWLAQRLRRIDRRRTAFVPWEALWQQFGPDYERIRDFRRVFLVALRQVLARYQAARVELDEKGMTLRDSEPPVTERLVQLPRPCS